MRRASCRVRQSPVSCLRPRPEKRSCSSGSGASCGLKPQIAEFAADERHVIEEVRFAFDSPLEGSGFELSVPLGHLPRRGLLDHRVELWLSRRRSLWRAVMGDNRMARKRAREYADGMAEEGPSLDIDAEG
jgi:hypothetical protein